LVDLVRPSVAKDIMFSARRLQSDEALRIGLVNLVVDAEELEDVTVAYAQTLAANAPLSIRASKFYIDQLGLERSQSEEARMDAMQQESALCSRLFILAGLQLSCGVYEVIRYGYSKHPE
jgi:enoyl-CoA hydratase/carnithine racemase